MVLTCCKDLLSITQGVGSCITSLDLLEIRTNTCSTSPCRCPQWLCLSLVGVFCHLSQNSQTLNLSISQFWFFFRPSSHRKHFHGLSVQHADWVNTKRATSPYFCSRACSAAHEMNAALLSLWPACLPAWLPSVCGDGWASLTSGELPLLNQPRYGRPSTW
ncbi:hypothetical protein VTI74DRAFT_6801 [Chaetomium olivicolor]